MEIPENKGIGMTSDRTRDRLIKRLKDQEIMSNSELERIRNDTRKIFVDK